MTIDDTVVDWLQAFFVQERFMWGGTRNQCRVDLVYQDSSASQAATIGMLSP
jgi:hypothetical protein